VFDCFIEGAARLVSFTSTQPTRLLPIWKLLLPTVVYGVAHYAIASLAKYRVSVSMKNDLWQRKVTTGGVTEPAKIRIRRVPILYCKPIGFGFVTQSQLVQFNQRQKSV